MAVDFAPHNMTSNTAPAPYTVTASTEWAGGANVFKAFDGGVGADQYWLTAGIATGWLKLDMGSIYILWKLDNYSIRANTIPEPNRMPKDWTMQGSNDNVNWDILDTVTNETSWGNGETRNFTCDIRNDYYRYFKLNVTANNGDGYLQIGELYLYGDNSNIPYTLKNRNRNRMDFSGYSLVDGIEDFAPHNMTTPSTPAPYVVSASSDYYGLQGRYAFDGATTYWLSVGVTGWLKLDVGDGYEAILDNYNIKVNSIPEPNRAPKDWTMQGSVDNLNWDILDTRTGETSWLNGESRNFVCSSKGGYYRYFKVDITLNNGDASYSQIQELYLYGTYIPSWTSYLKNKKRDMFYFKKYSLDRY